jgi:vacuolar-type H+-ATPase subunit I/STV1
MIEKRFTDVWCSETGHIGFTDYGIEKKFSSSEFEEYLNKFNEEIRPIVLTTHISSEDFDKIERILVKQFDSHSEIHSINKISALQRENKRLKEGNEFNRVLVERAINKKIDEVITSSDYGDVSRGIRIFAMQVLIELKQELGV